MPAHDFAHAKGSSGGADDGAPTSLVTPEGVATAATVVVPTERTGAVNRDISHVDMTKWMGLIGISAFARYVTVHPFAFVMARERTHREHSNTLSILREAYKDGGVRVIFRGVGASAGGNAFGETAYVGAFEYLRKKLPFANKVTRDAWAGFIADVTNVLMAAPFDVIAARQITAGSGISSNIKYEPVHKMGRTMYRQGGPRALFAGTSANLAYSPSSALWWPLYEWSKAVLYAVLHPPLLRYKDSYVASFFPRALFDEGDNALLNGGAGVIASVVATTVYCPVLVVRTRLQVASAYLNIPPGSSKVLHICKDLLRNEGWKGFFKGVQVNAACAVVEGIMFSQLYEVTKRLCDVTIDDD
jgi:hypothetical protein